MDFKKKLMDLTIDGEEQPQDHDMAFAYKVISEVRQLKDLEKMASLENEKAIKKIQKSIADTEKIIEELKDFEGAEFVKSYRTTLEQVKSHKS